MKYDLGQEMVPCVVVYREGNITIEEGRPLQFRGVDRKFFVLKSPYGNFYRVLEQSSGMMISNAHSTKRMAILDAYDRVRYSHIGGLIDSVPFRIRALVMAHYAEIDSSSLKIAGGEDRKDAGEE